MSGVSRAGCAASTARPHRLVPGALAVVLLAAGAAAAAGGLPRVFFTPAERTALTADRRAGRPLRLEAPPAAAPPAVSTPAAGTSVAEPTQPTGAPQASQLAAASPASAPPRLEGVTIGRDARRAAWIAGERVADGARWRGYRVQVTRDGARLLAADGSVRHVRVGMELPR